MSARRLVSDATFTLTNPSYIDFPRTDGSPSQWPTTTARIVDTDGNVNYFAYLDLDEYQNKRWRAYVGNAVSIALKMPEGPNYVFRDFPAGYRLFDHNKGPADNCRHDLYLCGSKKRFRSMNEFVPHAIWLMGSPSELCVCKYCGSKKAQKEITASMSAILRTTPTSSPVPSRVRRDKGKARETVHRVRDTRPRDTKAYAAVQKQVVPLKASPDVLKQPMLVERSNDLRGIYSKAAASVPRWFRLSEVVWVALEKSIPSESTDGAPAIEYWPAVVDEIKVKSKSIPRNSANGYGSAIKPHTSSAQASSSSMSVDFHPDESERGPMIEPSDEPMPWTVQQYMRYKVQFLGISCSLTVDSDDVLPYQAYMPSNEIMHVLATFPVEKLHFDKASLARFNPCPDSIPPSFDESVAAYALALQIGSTLSSYWCLTDDYELKYGIPTAPKPQPPPPPSISQNKAPQTLQEVIEAASRQNAQTAKSTNAYYTDVSTIDGNTSQAALNKTVTRVMGIPPPPDKLEQTRFQGLWWGAERIWVDDIIRLKIPRRSLAPNGANNILPPSGPGNSSLDTWLTTNQDTTDLGAGMRGVFLRLDGILAVKVPTSAGMKTEARICGVLYELADEDWVEPFDSSIATPTPAPNDTSVANSSPSMNGASSAGANGAPTAVSKSSQQPSSGPSTTPTNAHNLTPSKVEPSNSGLPRILSLPLAPEGYKFRPILKPGYEFVGAMNLISGRYYPRLLAHPRMIPIVRNAITQDLVGDSNNLWALEGLSGGYFNSVDPVRYKKHRFAMVEDAEKEAMRELQAYKDTRMTERQTGADNGTMQNRDSMDIDDIYA